MLHGIGIIEQVTRSTHGTYVLLFSFFSSLNGGPAPKSSETRERGSEAPTATSSLAEPGLVLKSPLPSHFPTNISHPILHALKATSSVAEPALARRLPVALGLRPNRLALRTGVRVHAAAGCTRGASDGSLWAARGVRLVHDWRCLASDHTPSHVLSRGVDDDVQRGRAHDCHSVAQCVHQDVHAQDAARHAVRDWRVSCIALANRTHEVLVRCPLYK